MKEYCNGCAAVRKYNYCRMKLFNLGIVGRSMGDCPCTECLVKVTCLGICVKYANWQSLVIKENAPNIRKEMEELTYEPL